MSSSALTSSRVTGLLFAIMVTILCFSYGNSHAADLTADEILQRVVHEGLGTSARVAVTITSFKGKKKIAQKSFWFVQQTEGKTTKMLIDFEKPEDSKGLRFLFIVNPDKEPQAYMYLPALGKTLPLAADDPSTDIGGTGLNMDDFMAFAPRPGQKAVLQGEDKVDGRDCYVIRVDVPNAGKRTLWISKKGFMLLKSEQYDAKGKLKRTFRVVEFFKTQGDKEFPREEEVGVPDKNLRIRVRQESAVLNIVIPEGRLDPKKFGTFKRGL